MKPQHLAFTEKVKRIGERWQLLTPREKAPYGKAARALKRKYHIKMNAYKMTENYRGYQEYLVEFKINSVGKRGACSGFGTEASDGERLSEGKEPRLEQNESTEAVRASHGLDHQKRSKVEARSRNDSMGSVALFSPTCGLVFSSNVAGIPLSMCGGQQM